MPSYCDCSEWCSVVANNATGQTLDECIDTYQKLSREMFNIDQLYWRRRQSAIINFVSIITFSRLRLRPSSEIVRVSRRIAVCLECLISFTPFVERLSSPRRLLMPTDLQLFFVRTQVNKSDQANVQICEAGHVTYIIRNLINIAKISEIIN